MSEAETAKRFLRSLVPSIRTTISSGEWLPTSIGRAVSPFMCAPSIGSSWTVVRPPANCSDCQTQRNPLQTCYGVTLPESKALRSPFMYKFLLLQSNVLKHSDHFYCLQNLQKMIHRLSSLLNTNIKQLSNSIALPYAHSTALQKQ